MMEDQQPKPRKKRSRTKNRTHAKKPKGVPLDVQIKKLKKQAMGLIRKSRNSKSKNTKKQINDIDHALEGIPKDNSQYNELQEKKKELEQTLNEIKATEPETLLPRLFDSCSSFTPIEQRIINSSKLDQLKQDYAVLNGSSSNKHQHVSPKPSKPLNNGSNASKQKEENPEIESSEGNSDNGEIPAFLRAAQSDDPFGSLDDMETLQEDNSDNSFDSAQDLGVTEGFTISVPGFGETFSDSDSEVAAIEVKDHYSDEELDNPLYDEHSDEESSMDGTIDMPPRKKQKTHHQANDKANKSDSIFISTLNGNAVLTPPVQKNKKKKKKNRMGQNARRRLQALESKNTQRKPLEGGKTFTTKQGKDNKIEANVAKPVEEDTKDLHPSWSARKKTTNIADFKGKKITFGEDSD